MPRTIDVTRTYVSIERLDNLIPPSADARATGTVPPLALEWQDRSTIPEWRALYAQVGGPWHWHDRDAWTDETLRAHLDRDAVRVYVVRAAGDETATPAGGMLELERHEDGSVEIVYLGLDQRLIGRRLGAWLVYLAVQEAFRVGGSRVWLHTCTLDAPAALPNYLARGFVITRTEQYQTSLPD
jgi:ribosomal protein S18 acetylase RimI-like enzyme